MAASRRLYEGMATSIKTAVDELERFPERSPHIVLQLLVLDLLTDLKQDNMQFKRDKFIKACGLEGVIQ